MDRTATFLDERRLLHGPWQMLERDVARLMISNGFDDVRIVGGSGDGGADILGVQGRELWVFQCKHSASTPPPRTAVQEIVDAGRVYGAQRLVVACSRPPSAAFMEEVARHERTGLKVEVADPRTLLALMSKTPEFPPSRRELRDYQDEASETLRQALIDTGRGQLVLATGLGKTVVIADVVADLLHDDLVKPDSVLVLAHTRAIVDQLHRAFWFQLPRWVPTHRLAEGEKPAFWDGVTFGTVQSALANLDSLPMFGLVIIDEAHHAGAETFQTVISRLEPPMLAGVTATPWRGDGYDIDSILGPALVKIGIADGLQRGFLTEVDYRLMADNLDWKFIQQVSKYRYSLKELNRRLIIPTRDDECARLITGFFRETRRRGGIVFSPTIEHANQFAAVLRHHGLRAEAVSSALSARERELLMARFRAGHLDIVTTVDIFNEGVDVPDVDILAFLRATHSRRIFVQQLGRGLRVSPGKDRVLVLDFVTDLRRIAEVIELDKAARDGDVERIGLGRNLVSFTDASAGSFLREWMLDQASLVLREDDPKLEVPILNFPRPAPPGAVQ